MIKLLMISLVMVSFACKSQENGALSIINDKFGKEAYISYNEARSYALVQQPVASNSDHYNSKYVIIKLADGDILKEGKIVRGYIKWVDSYQLELFETPGVIDTDQSRSDFVKFIDVRNLKNNK